MTRHTGQTDGFMCISEMIDVKEDIEILEDGIDLAARLMVKFIRSWLR